MRKFLLFIFAMTTCTATSVMAQENFELGKPNNDNYRYLDEYKALKKYINKSKYPNFKLGIGTTVPEYLQKSTVYKMTNKNFTETVAGNAMKMASCVDGNGNMNFTRVKNYVKEATAAGLNVYGHTLAWHSQQPKAWLLNLIADKPDPNSPEEYKVIAEKDFRTNKSIGWKSSESDYGYSTTFDNTNGLKVSCTKKNSNTWDVQFQAMENIALTAGKKYTMTITVKGSKNGEINGHLGDWNTNNDTDPATGYNFNLKFTTSWQDIDIEVTPTVDGNFLLLQVNTVDFTGDVYIKTIKFGGYQGKLIPQSKQEIYDALVGAMDKWISGMMEACDGKVKGWDLVNEAISGGGDDGQGNYLLQHSAKYNPNGNPDATWDVGGDNFYWQDYLGDIDYVRQACRLARKYGPKDVKLFINDYNLESDWDDNKKLKSLINWIKKWEADGVTKIDGIGTQMHINCYISSTNQKSVEEHIVKMFKLMAESGKLCRVSELDMGFVKGSTNVPTSEITEAQHKKMANFYQWIVEQYLTIIPPEQQWGICQWCPTDSPENSGWRANEPVGIWDLDYYRKHVYAGFAEGLGGEAFDDEVIPGDVNGDGLVNVTDIVATVNYIMEKPSDGFIKEAADLSGDGEVNVTDIVKMVSIIMASDN